MSQPSSTEHGFDREPDTRPPPEYAPGIMTQHILCRALTQKHPPPPQGAANILCPDAAAWSPASCNKPSNLPPLGTHQPGCLILCRFLGPFPQSQIYSEANPATTPASSSLPLPRAVFCNHVWEILV